jgi:predicted Holliday junction resolvase-like endonuclease
MRVEAIKAEKAIRADAIARSKTVNHGFTSENFAPLLMDFSHKDFRHMGDPIDYLVPVGASEVRAGTKDKIDKVILLDIKTGKAQLNKVQRRIRDAIVEGRIYFATYNTDTSNLRLWPEEKTDGTKSVLELEPKSTPSEEESIAPSDDA